MNKTATFILVCSLIAPIGMAVAADGATTAAGPTVESAIAAEQDIAKALLTNDADAVEHLLADDWCVISATGALGGQAREDFVGAIRSKIFTRNKMVLSDIHARVYGNVAVVTSQLDTAGFNVTHNFTVTERQTDVLVWRDGGWKSVLTHEGYK